MENREAIEILKNMKWSITTKFNAINNSTKALDLAISALEKQEQSCETCKHGKFGDEACINCRVGFPNHYEAEEES